MSQHKNIQVFGVSQASLGANPTFLCHGHRKPDELWKFSWCVLRIKVTCGKLTWWKAAASTVPTLHWIQLKTSLHWNNRNSTIQHHIAIFFCFHCFFLLKETWEGDTDIPSKMKRCGILFFFFFFPISQQLKEKKSTFGMKLRSTLTWGEDFTEKLKSLRMIQSITQLQSSVFAENSPFHPTHPLVFCSARLPRNQFLQEKRWADI